MKSRCWMSMGHPSAGQPLPTTHFSTLAAAVLLLVLIAGDAAQPTAKIPSCSTAWEGQRRTPEFLLHVAYKGSQTIRRWVNSHREGRGQTRRRAALARTGTDSGTAVSGLLAPGIQTPWESLLTNWTWYHSLYITFFNSHLFWIMFRAAYRITCILTCIKDRFYCTVEKYLL